ncbi:MAG TPA: hypothetical protein VKB39_03950 [Candidatus Baltobacteraceae bacterium]|nr:hypothetical protein [Candidatus Baltobacteraceae bacterium]
MKPGLVLIAFFFTLVSPAIGRAGDAGLIGTWNCYPAGSHAAADLQVVHYSADGNATIKTADETHTNHYAYSGGTLVLTSPAVEGSLKAKLTWSGSNTYSLVPPAGSGMKTQNCTRA